MASSSGVPKDDNDYPVSEHVSQVGTSIEAKEVEATEILGPRPVSRGSRSIHANKSRQSSHHEILRPTDPREHPAYQDEKVETPDSKLIQARDDLISKELSIILANARDLDRRLSKISKVLQEQERALKKRETQINERDDRVYDREKWLGLRERRMYLRESFAKQREARIVEREKELAIGEPAVEIDARNGSLFREPTSSTGQKTLKDFWRRQAENARSFKESEVADCSSKSASCNTELKEDKNSLVKEDIPSPQHPKTETLEISENPVQLGVSSIPITPKAQKHKSRLSPFSFQTPPPMYRPPVTISTPSETTGVESKPASFWGGARQAAVSKLTSLFKPDGGSRQNIKSEDKAAVVQKRAGNQGIKLVKASQESSKGTMKSTARRHSHHRTK